MANTATYVNGFNVGTDVSFAFADQYGDLFSDDMLGHLTEFSSQSEDNVIKVTPISNGGIPIYQTIWNGISGRLGFVRTGPAFTQLFIDLANAYYQGGIISQFSISANVRNRDGTVDSYLYSGVQFTQPRNGDFRSTREVSLEVGFRASLLTATGSIGQLISGIASTVNV